MKVFLDEEYRCSLDPSRGTMSVETDFFDGKCDAFIEGYRFIPACEAWTRSDGAVFHGEMIAPWKPWVGLDSDQRAYEQELLASLREENAALLDDMAQLVEEVYESDRVILE